MKCLDCDGAGGTFASRAKAAIAARGDVNINEWLRASARPTDEFFARVFQKAPVERAYEEVFINLGQGVSFITPHGLLVYEERACKVFDCYKGYLSLRDADSGRVRWRRRIPLLRLPVFPFVTDIGVAFIGEKSYGYCLMILDSRSGRTLAEVRLPSDGIVISGANPVSAFPVYHDGFIVVQGCRLDTSDATAGHRSQKRVPANLLVVECRTPETSAPQPRSNSGPR